MPTAYIAARNGATVVLEVPVSLCLYDVVHMLCIRCVMMCV